MVNVTLNQIVPDFTLPATSSQLIHLADFRGKNIVIYFYPKDCTSGCTLEGLAFRDYYPQFYKLNTVIWGVSRDTVKLHEKFKSDNKFPFPLLSDTDETVCNLFGVMKDKNMYGRKVRGIERSTFLIDSNSRLIHEWRNVKVEGHVKEVLAVVKKLTQQD